MKLPTPTLPTIHYSHIVTHAKMAFIVANAFIDRELSRFRTLRRAPWSWVRNYISSFFCYLWYIHFEFFWYGILLYPSISVFLCIVLVHASYISLLDQHSNVHWHLCAGSVYLHGPGRERRRKPLHIHRLLPESGCFHPGLPLDCVRTLHLMLSFSVPRFPIEFRDVED